VNEEQQGALLGAVTAGKSAAYVRVYRIAFPRTAICP
jgi:hypothetical protein